MVDDLVRESMQKGEFDNLAGQGKPLDYSEHNPMVDTTTHNLNKIMVNNGFKPEWIMLNKEIRSVSHISRVRRNELDTFVGLIKGKLSKETKKCCFFFVAKVHIP